MRHNLLLLGLLFAGLPVAAHQNHTGGIQADKNGDIKPTFDIVHARVTTEGNIARFHMAVAGRAGKSRPEAGGSLAGSDVYSYVWPTSLGPETVGFAAESGILALAVTAHPDFDDTPLYDENRDGDTGNDGDDWHSHWVVLAPHADCPEGGLSVVDIPEGQNPPLPSTWPGLPLLIDSPAWQPVFSDESLDIQVAFDRTVNLDNISFDAVTAGLRVNQSVHAPLLCVVDVFDTAGGLTLPGKANQ